MSHPCVPRGNMTGSLIPTKLYLGDSETDDEASQLTPPLFDSQDSQDSQKTEPWLSQSMTPASELEEPWAMLCNVRNKTATPLINDCFLVGRNTDSHYVLDNATVGGYLMSCSRKHFGIYRVQTRVGHHVVSIRDYSNTATYINGIQVGQNASRPLSDGDRIALGKPYFEVFVFYNMQYRNKVPGIPSEVTKNYTIMDDLGKGGFGKVYLVTKQATNQELAMKALKLNLDVQNVSPLNEASIMYKVRHVHIVRVFDTMGLNDDFFIFMEYMPGGDLYRYLEHRGKNFDESEAKFVCYQLTEAVAALHELNIVHRDIKPLNVLLSSKEEYPLVKLTDFGLSKILSMAIEPVRTLCGTRSFAAPEVSTSRPYNGKTGYFDNRCDIWSLGVVFYYCLSRRLPFESNDLVVEERRSKGIFDFEPSSTWDNITAGAKKLIRSMIKSDYRERVYAKDALKNPYLHNDQRLRAKYKKLLSSLPNVSREEECGDENDPFVLSANICS